MRLVDRVGRLPKKSKEPFSVSVLNSWLSHAESLVGDDVRGGRLGWLIASAVAIGAVQRTIDSSGRKLFLLRGGTFLQFRIDVPTRATKDIDGIVRGSFEEFINDRVRDVVDLILLRDLAIAAGSPSVSEIRSACLAVFESRAIEAEQLGLSPRPWPPEVRSYPHWDADYAMAAESVGLEIPIADAVELLNDWIGEIDNS